jgi:dihydroorotase
MLSLIKNATIINEGKKYLADILIEDEIIKKIGLIDEADFSELDTFIDATGLLLLPGVIDDQVHFREPGLTHKADIFSESCAAAAGGVTSYIDMPNTNPPTISNELLFEKLRIASENSVVNYAFMLGASESNLDEILSIDKSIVPALKIFLGSSTGNLLVSNKEIIYKIFKSSPVIIAAHCEDDGVIARELEEFKHKYGENIPFQYHSKIRSAEACYKSSSFAVKTALKTGARLHLFHLSTAAETELLSTKKLNDKQITAEVCVHHLWFNEDDYKKLGAKIKWNPAIKTESDRLALIEALKNGKIDVVATDHAPHTLDEKNKPYLKCPSGAPMVQHSLNVMLELAERGNFNVEEVVKWMCHNPAELFKIDRRGFIKENYYADLVLVSLNEQTFIKKENLFYKCGWSPLEGESFYSRIITTFVNGRIVYHNGKIIDKKAAKQLKFNN